MLHLELLPDADVDVLVGWDLVVAAAATVAIGVGVERGGRGAVLDLVRAEALLNRLIFVFHTAGT